MRISGPKTPRLLRLRADAFSIKQQWADVVSTLNEIRTDFPDELNKRDASKLLLAAHRSDAPAIIEDVLAEYPDIFDTPAFRNIAEGMSYTPAPLDPLKRKNADARLERASQALSDVESSISKDTEQ